MELDAVVEHLVHQLAGEGLAHTGEAGAVPLLDAHRAAEVDEGDQDRPCGPAGHPRQQRLDQQQQQPQFGPKRRQALLKAFGSVARVRKASEEKLAEVVGPKVAAAVRSR